MRKLLIVIAWILRPKKYPQIWWFRRLRKVAGYVYCRRHGHEISETEWGYDGGDTEDRWCRWCNALIVVPAGRNAWMVRAGKWGMAIGEKINESTTVE